MKNRKNKICFSLFIVAFICPQIFTFSQTIYDLPDVEYQGRYVNLTNSPPKFYDADFTVTVNIHESMPAILHVTSADLQGMASIWNDVGAFLKFNLIDGGTGDIIKAEEPNYQQFNVIGADEPLKENAKIFDFDYDPNVEETSTLAFTKNHLPPLDCSKWYHPVIFGGDIIINSHPAANVHILTSEEQGDKTKQNIDLKRVVLHELGHLAGIQHHPDATDNDIMVKDTGPGVYKTILSPLDKFALKRLYGINPNDADGKPYDVGQLSSIPCALFDTSDPEKLIGLPPATSNDPPPPPPPGDCEFEDIEMSINGDETTDEPCISLPIVLKPFGNCNNPKWWNWAYWVYEGLCTNVHDFYSQRAEFYDDNTVADPDEKCINVPNPTASLCSTGSLEIFCECKFFAYDIALGEVDPITHNWIGNFYTQCFTMQVNSNESSTMPYETVTIGQNEINELGISLVPGKMYGIEIRGLHHPGTTAKDYIRYFRLAPSGISYSNTNLISSPPSFTTNTFSNFLVFIQTNTFVHNPLGTNISLDNVTTTNYMSPIMDMTVTASNINISATNSISISNSTITGNFVASIVDAPGCLQGRMANPDDDKISKPTANNYLNESYVYYNSKQIATEQDNSTVIDDIEKEEKQKSELSLLLIPNPSSSGVFNFSQKFSENNNYDLTIYNLLGEKVFNSIQPNPQNLIDISSNPKGIYFVEIRNGEEMSVQKIVYQ